MKSNELNYFRPKARHIFTIGKDLIKDDFSALIELVKNSYDADATKIDIQFKEHKGGIEIVISDDGHGMSEDDIRTKWLIPSTDNKVGDRKSPKGRTFQGQKGIGRYAASVLGFDLEMKTIKDGIETIVNINWDKFSNNNKFLDQINVNIKVKKTNKSNGTIIRILGDNTKLNIWTEKQLGRLKNELSQLISPFGKNKNDNFSMFLNSEEILSFDQSNFYDYKISGSFIEKESKFIFTYINSDKKGNFKEEETIINSNDCYFSESINRELPGDFSFEFLVIDRDPVKEREEVSKIMGNPRELARSKAKVEFDKHSGVKLYRGGFRIRPYGDTNDDWLGLNSRRVNQPTLRLSTNQVLGYIRIGNEKESGLEELTSRGGLKENKHFWGLKCVVGKVLNELELKRQTYRKETGLGRMINKVLEYDELKENILDTIKNVEIPNKDNVTKELSSNINKVFEKIKTREKYLEDILFIYERQATLGKIIGELIHEIKQPLAYFKGKLKKVELIIENLEELIKYNENIVEFRDIAIRYRENAIRILRFLKNIEPLAINKRKEDYFSLYKILDLSFEPLLSIMKDGNIQKVIKGDDYDIYCDKTDMIVAISNFIDNSIYWLSLSDKSNKRIEIETYVKEKELYILFKDNGIGLLKEELKDDIFDPGITLKEKGTGLGLSIAGEVLKRNNIRLSLIDSEEGFILQLIINIWKE